MRLQTMGLKRLEMGMSGGYRQIGLMELKELKMCELILKLNRNRGNIKGIEEYLKRFGVRKGREKKGLRREEIRDMLVTCSKNIDAIMDEMEMRLELPMMRAERRNICKFRSGRDGRMMSWDDL